MDNGAIVHIDYDLFEVDSDRLIERPQGKTSPRNMMSLMRTGNTAQ